MICDSVTDLISALMKFYFEKDEKKKVFIAVYNNMQTLNFKPQQRFTFLAAVNHLSGPLRKQKLTSAGSKGHVVRS